MTKARREYGDLSQLGALKEALARAAQEAQAQAAALRLEAEREARERELFARSVGPVARLPDKRRAALARTPPAPEPLQRERDERAALAATLSDEIDVESLLDTDEQLSFRRPEVGPDVVKKLRRGHWAMQAELDLHGLRRDAAREQLTAFLHDAARHGLRCVRIVHGKGNGSPGREPVLKSKVRGWLVQKAEVLAFAQARASEGGAGALVVLLRPA